MNPAVLKRFVILMVVLVVGAVVVMTFVPYFDPPPGDYETRQGDIDLTNGEYEAAIDWFERALEIRSDHRGALMGRAVALMQLERYDEAEAELTHLIEVLREKYDPNDPTGVGALAAAYANRGILYDRTERYESALQDYVRSLKTDEESVSGPDLFHKVLHNPNPSTVRDRAKYIAEQLELPPDQRVMRVPELDEEQRMHKP